MVPPDPEPLPVFCGGRVNGVTASPASSIGRVGYTVSRSSSSQGHKVRWLKPFSRPLRSLE
jgi:hypothetical protein